MQDPHFFLNGDPWQVFFASQGAECGGLGTGSVRYMMGSKVTLLGWKAKKIQATVLMETTRPGKHTKSY